MNFIFNFIMGSLLQFIPAHSLNAGIVLYESQDIGPHQPYANCVVGICWPEASELSPTDTTLPR